MEMSYLNTSVLLIILWITYALSSWFFQRSASQEPIVESTWLDYLTRKSTTTKDLVKDAYQKYSKNSRVFRIYSMCGLQYVLPCSVLEEVRKLPASILDPDTANEELLNLIPYLTRDYHDIVPFITRDIHRAIPVLIPEFVEEISFSIKKNLPAKNSVPLNDNGVTYYPTAIHPGISKSVGIVTSRIFLGKSLARDERWTTKAKTFATSVSMYGMLLNKVPRVIKRLLTPLLPIRPYVFSLKKMMRAKVVRAVEENQGTKPTGNGTGPITPRDNLLLNAMVDFVKGRPKYKNASMDEIVTGISNRIIALIFAVIDTTSFTTTHVIYDIIGHPRTHFANPMIAEIKEVLAKNGGQWTLKALNELKMLDSFIKESQRLHPLGLTLSARNVVAKGGYTFKTVANDPSSKPIYLPQGARFELPVYGVNRDPATYPDPDTFQGFRFAKDAVASSSQISDKFMSFGFGLHACPGRYFALVMVKLIAIEFLLNYEWKEIDRLEDWAFGVNTIPDMATKVSIKRKDSVEEAM